MLKKWIYKVVLKHYIYEIKNEEINYIIIMSKSLKKQVKIKFYKFFYFSILKRSEYVPMRGVPVFDADFSGLGR